MLQTALALSGTPRAPPASAGYNGVAVSHNGGKNFTAANVFGSPHNTSTFARFSAFVDEGNTIYTTGGSWPSNQDTRDAGFHPLNEFTSVNTATGELKHTLSPLRANGVDDDDKPPGPTGAYHSSVAKSTDGGKTFTVLANATVDNQYYPNGIGCGDDQHCVYAAEAAGGAFAGSYLFTTNDGGATWKQTARYINNATHLYSMVEVRFVSATEVYASGAMNTQADGVFGQWHVSKDAGMTWSVTSVPKFYIQRFAFPEGPGGVGHGTGFNYPLPGIPPTCAMFKYE